MIWIDAGGSGLGRRFGNVIVEDEDLKVLDLFKATDAGLTGPEILLNATTSYDKCALPARAYSSAVRKPRAWISPSSSSKTVKSTSPEGRQSLPSWLAPQCVSTNPTNHAGRGWGIVLKQGAKSLQRQMPLVATAQAENVRRVWEAMS